jgi:hypothetical protein
VIDRAAAFITGEGNWLPLAMGVALLSLVVVWFLPDRHLGPAPNRTGARERTQEAMNLFVGLTLLVMGVGHLLAVTVKLQQGTLNGSPALLYLIGVALVIPSMLIVLNANRAKAAVFNAWMAATLVVLGLINIPLAIPALLNIAYSRHGRPRTGLIIAVAFVLVNVGLFTGGMLFLLSGARTFEEFTM